MKNFATIGARSPRWQRYTWVLAIVWTVVVAGSLLWNIVQLKEHSLETARIQARSAFMKDIVYRRWNAMHGGVYAPVTEKTQPNPYLSVPDREIITPSGKMYTLINPAYMTRQMYELAEEEYGIYGHITSLKPIRPENAADTWETQALQTFERGETEFSSVEEMKGQKYMRLMSPLITEKSCLKCHAAQGYKEGDIRGGISVSVPLAPLLLTMNRGILVSTTGHTLLWLMGLLGIVLGTRRLTRGELERKQTEEALRESEEKYSKAFRVGLGAMAIVTLEDGRFIEVNDNFAIMYGYRHEEIIGRTATELGLWQRPEEREEIVRMLKAKGRVNNLERELRTKSGEIRVVLFSSETIEYKGEHCMVSGAVDITERKTMENEREITIDLLHTMNASNSLHELMKDVMILIKNWTGCDAVGIRLKKGHDFPYYEVSGFSTEHILLENDLCSLDNKGELIHDDAGNPVLECMCGNIIRGRFDPSKPFFTEYGSFWSNCTTELLASTTKEDRQSRTRNTCNGEGYESVVLIPLRYGNETFGLLQVNDKRKDLFTAESISQLESMAGGIAIAIAQRQTQKALLESHNKLAKAQKIAHLGSYEWDVDTGEVTWSDEMYRIFGVDPEKFGRAIVFEDVIKLIHPDDVPRINENTRLILEGGTSLPIEYRVLHPDGKERIFLGEAEAIFNENGKPDKVIGTVQDITERKQAEEKIQESEEFRTDLLNNSPNGIIVINPDTSVRYVNPALEKLTGFTFAELAGIKAPYPWWPEESIEENSEALKQGMKFSPKGLEQHFQNKNGERFWVEITSLPVIRSGEFKYHLASWIDITERKKMEETLQKSYEKYQSLVETTSDFIWEMDLNGVYTYCSPQMEGLWGLKPEEMLGKTPFDLLPTQEKEQAIKGFAALLKSASPFSNMEVQSFDGARQIINLDISGVPFFNTDGKLEGYRGITRDITERKKAEEALRESEEKISKAFRVSPEAMALATLKEGRFIEVNDYFANMYGYSHEEIIGHTANELGLYVRLEDREEIVRRLQEDGAVSDLERELRTKSGEILVVLFSAEMIEIKGELCMVSVAKDITDRKRAEKQLQAVYQQEKALRQELEVEIKKRVEFSRALVHELKTPLTPIISSSDLLVDQLKEQPFLNIARNIYRGASKLSNRIDELLDLTRGEIGMIKLHRRPLDLLRICHRVAGDMAPMFSSAEQSLTLDLPPSLPKLRADGDRLQQVIMNLLTNSSKFTPPGGKVTLRVKQAEAAVIVEVQDTGPGIKEELQERLFNPYYRVEGDRERLSGLGLGLALCKTLVELHGGRIWVESHLGKGSTFSFSIPLDSAHQKSQVAETGGKS